MANNINTFELLFSLLLVLLTYRIINTPNIIESVLLLILLAIIFSIFLFFYKMTFLGILYLAVYIGAVTVFFLFVVMMTDLNNSVLNEDNSNFMPKKYRNWYLICVIVLSCSLSNLFITALAIIKGNNIKSSSFFADDNIDAFNSNIESIAFLLFNEHSGPFILISIIILVSLIGSIFITKIANNSLKIEPIRSELTTQNLSDENVAQDMETQAARSLSNSLNLSKND